MEIDQIEKPPQFQKSSKKIQKRMFTPIIEEGIVYKYEDNPQEYKRIRKF